MLGARTRSALCRGGIAVRGEPWVGLGGSPRAQPWVCGLTSPSTPPRLPQCPHPAAAPAPPLALRRPHQAPLAGVRSPEPRAGGAARPTSPSARLCCAPSSRVGTSDLGLFLYPRRPRPPLAPDGGRRILRQPQPALYSLGVVLKRVCRETPAGGRGAVRTAVSTAARGGQRAFTQRAFPAPPHVYK